MTQKQFVIGLIEAEINRDLEQRAAEAKQHETAAVSAFKGSSEAANGSNTVEQRESGFEDVSDGESEESEDEELDDDEVEDIDKDEGESEDEDFDDEEAEGIDEDQGESEDQGMSMGM